MSAAGMQVIEEAERLDAAAELEAQAAASRRTRRLLRAVETYKAVCAARGQAPTKDDGWFVLLSALSTEGK